MPITVSSGTTELRANRLERDELEMLQRRALRSWRDSDWLARNNPSAWDALADFPDEVWLDLGGGVGESQQTPGAIVVGCDNMLTTFLGDSRTGEKRLPDVRWSICDGVPAADGSVDRIIVPENTIRSKSPADQNFILKEISRALRVGGTLVFREEAALLQVLQSTLKTLGFALDTRSQRDDDDYEYTYTLTAKVIDALDLGTPLVQSMVDGVTSLAPVRQPTP